MRISNILFAAATLAATVLGAGTAGAVPVTNSLAITADVRNEATDLRTITSFSFDTVS